MPVGDRSQGTGQPPPAPHSPNCLWGWSPWAHANTCKGGICTCTAWGGISALGETFHGDSTERGGQCSLSHWEEMGWGESPQEDWDPPHQAGGMPGEKALWDTVSDKCAPQARRWPSGTRRSWPSCRQRLGCCDATWSRRGPGCPPPSSHPL